MSDTDKTNAFRPAPRRPKYGWSAWEATVGYIAQHDSPDATLKLEMYPLEYVIGWSATLTWGQEIESASDENSLADALSKLWQEVESHHRLLKDFDAASRRPANYDYDNWLDRPTFDALSNLVHLTDLVFEGDWRVIILYRPVETPKMRLQTRLLGDNSKISRGGNGATLREACRDLYVKSAPLFQKIQRNK